MKIVHITPDYPSIYYTGGQGVFTREIALRQARQGNKVVVLAPQSSQYVGWNRLKRRERDDRVLIRRIETGPGTPVIDGMTLFPPTIPYGKMHRVRRLIREADIIHVHNFWFTGFLHPILREIMNAGTPYVVSPFLEDFINPPHSGNSRHWWRMLRELCGTARAVIAWSRDECVKLSRFNRHIIVTHGGIDPAEFPQRPASQRMAGAPAEILTVGNICERKNTAALIDALPQVRAPVHCTIVGAVVSEPYAKLCRSRTAAHGLREQVTFAGHLSRDALLDRYRNADLFVLPSLSEAFGLAIIEAMASGLPVLVSKNSLAAEHITDMYDGVLFDPADVKSIEKRITILLEDTETAAWIATNGRKKVLKSFSWDSTARECLSLYEKVLINEPLPGYSDALFPDWFPRGIHMAAGERGLGLGWFHREPDEVDRWMGAHAFLLLGKAPEDTVLEIEATSPFPDGAQHLELSLEGRPFARLNLFNRRHIHRVKLPDGAQSPLRLSLSLDRLMTEEMREGDPRPLGAKVRRVACVPGTMGNQGHE